MRLAMLAAMAGIVGLAEPASALDKVKFGTNWLADPEAGGFYQALADGTYEKYGRLGSAGFPATFSFRGKASPSTRRFSHFVTSMTVPVCFRLERLAGWGLHPPESAALSRRTRQAVIQGRDGGRRSSRESRRSLCLTFWMTAEDGRQPPHRTCYPPTPSAVMKPGRRATPLPPAGRASRNPR
jgi:hypothetical protein